MPLSNYLPSSQIIQPGVCLSSNPPAAPYNGQVIYETDTGKTKVWNGSAWVMLTNSTAPPGLELIKVQTVGSNVSTVTVNSCFTSSYDNYVITLSNVGYSALNEAVLFKLTSGGTPTTNSWYGNTFYVAISSSGGLTNAPFVNTAYAECASINSYNGWKNSARFEVQAPYLAETTRLQYSSADSGYFRFGEFIHFQQTSYDGFQLSGYTGTFTAGTIRVYGYRNSI